MRTSGPQDAMDMEWSVDHIHQDCLDLTCWIFLGLMYFCMNDMRAIRSLIDTLRIPSLDTRVCLSIVLRGIRLTS